MEFKGITIIQEWCTIFICEKISFKVQLSYQSKIYGDVNLCNFYLRNPPIICMVPHKILHPIASLLYEHMTIAATLRKKLFKIIFLSV